MPSSAPAVSTAPVCHWSTLCSDCQDSRPAMCCNQPLLLYTLGGAIQQAPVDTKSEKVLGVFLCVPATLAVPDADHVRAPHMAEVSQGPSAAALPRQLAPATVTHQMLLGMHGHQHSPTRYQPIGCLGPLLCCSKATHQARASRVWCCKLQDMHRASPSSKTFTSLRCCSQHPG